eukprot:GHVR01106544.1.p1 GENE.GHVR01106544.1~~GHVR01106544.1.p1  ORF type:complete len:179 (+),score=13.80 GHVR01106544.1:119-655(+)
MSRLNHDCRQNCCFHYYDRLGVLVLIARRTIMEGEELMYSYFPNSKYKIRIKKLRMSFNIICDCYMCRDEGKDMRDAYDDMLKYHQEISQYMEQGNSNQAMITGKMLLALYKKYDESSSACYSVCFELYQCAITKRSTFNEGKELIKMAYDYIRKHIGDDDDDTVKNVRRFLDSTCDS